MPGWFWSLPPWQRLLFWFAVVGTVRVLFSPMLGWPGPADLLSVALGLVVGYFFRQLVDF